MRCSQPSSCCSCRRYTYTGMLMTENAFFPAVVATCFAIALTLERPTLLRQALVLAAIGLTFVVRPQGIVLLPIYVTALALKLTFDLRSPGGPRGIRYVQGELRRFLPTALTLVLLGGGYVVRKLIQGVGLETGLGSYGGVLMFDWYDPSTAADWVVDHFAEIGLSVALIPVSALIVLFGLSVRGWASSCCGASVRGRRGLGVRADRGAGRDLCVPLLAAHRGAQHVQRRAAALPGSGPVARARSATSAVSDGRCGVRSGGAALHPRPQPPAEHRDPVGHLCPHSAAPTLRPALQAARNRRRRSCGWADSPPPLRSQFCLVRAARVVVTRDRGALPRRLLLLRVRLGSRPLGSDARIDLDVRTRAGSTNESVVDSNAVYVYGATPDPFGEAQIMWQTEFWNRSVGTVYTLGPSDPGLTASPATFDALTGRIVPQSRRRRVRRRSATSIAPTTVKLAGRMLAQQEWLALYRIDPPMRLVTHLGGVFPDSWMGAFAALTHYAKPTVAAESTSASRVRAGEGRAHRVA